MVYRILGEYRFTDVIGNRVEAFPFTVTNASGRSEVFEPVPGFTAILSTGGSEQLTQYEGPSQTDPSCFPPTATLPGSLTPLGYRVKPGQTRGPWEVCMALSPGQRLVKALFADNNPDLHQNAVIALTGKIPQLATPLPLTPSPWALPDPCNLPAPALNGIGTNAAGGRLMWVHRNTRRAYGDCVTNAPGVVVSDVYVGYVPPNRFVEDVVLNGPVTAAPGFPGAKLLRSTVPEGQHDLLAVRFTRTIGHKRLYGQVAASFDGFDLCPQANMVANLAIAAKALFKAIGPGPAPTLSLPPPSPYCPS